MHITKVYVNFRHSFLHVFKLPMKASAFNFKGLDAQSDRINWIIFSPSSQLGLLCNTYQYKISQSSFIFAPFISVINQFMDHIVAFNLARNFRRKTNRKYQLPTNVSNSRRIPTKMCFLSTWKFIVPAGFLYSFEIPGLFPCFYNNFVF